ncbi:uncharacterized protein KRP23_14824 [Phytophthora ramorum]|uniref:uncharacterized protein n=1 Tax=Phytophthora ramorum TaxID=164328 RepID=UPI00309E8EE5|nr:hypothetical protein KRP23_14824 [Phytophthora ramorum]
MVALEADLAIGLKDSDFADGEVTFQCDFSLREAVIRDKIADPTEFLTQLFGPVPGPVLERMESRTSVSSDSSSFSFLSRDDIQPPLLRPSLSRSSRLDMSSQLSGRLTSKQTGDGSTVTKLA